MIWISLSLLLSVVLETTFINIPIVFAVLIFWAVTTQKLEIYIFGFFAGILVDLLTFNQLGFTSLFFLFFTFIIFLYRSKFEIRTLGFVGSFCFLGSLLYMFLKGTGNIFFGSLLITFIEIVAFKMYQKYSLQK